MPGRWAPCPGNIRALRRSASGSGADVAYPPSGSSPRRPARSRAAASVSCRHSWAREAATRLSRAGSSSRVARVWESAAGVIVGSASTVSRTASAWLASNSTELADSNSSHGLRGGVSDRAGPSARRRARSRITCTLVPPKPNELIAPRRGRSSVSVHIRGRVGTRSPASASGRAGSGRVSGCGGTTP